MQKLFKWLMTLFLGELPVDTEYAVWDLFFIKGSIVLFRVGVTILKILEFKIKSIEEENGQCGLEDTMMLIGQFCKQEITRRHLFKNLVNCTNKKDLIKQREIFKEEVTGNLKKEMKVVQDKLFPRVHFLKRFLLYDGLARYHSELHSHSSTDNGQQSNSGIG